MADCEGSSMRSWSELPITALALTFEKLDLPHRAGTLNCVACVCSSWAEAAAAATRSIKLCKHARLYTRFDPDRQAGTDSLQQWLHSQGSSVRDMELKSLAGVITSLPCPKLERLVLEGVHVDLRPGSQLVQDLSAATALTTLKLNHVWFEGEFDLTAVLMRLPVLQDLFLTVMNVDSETLHASTTSLLQDSPASPQQLWSAQSDCFGNSERRLTDAGMQFLCTLTSVRALQLQSMEVVTAAGLAALLNLRELNSLVLKDLACDFSLSAVPALSQLAALTRLRLCWALGQHSAAFDPVILTHMSLLKELRLNWCTAARGAAGAAELLSRLSQLPALEMLQLEYVKGLNKVPHVAFSQLTSSTALRSCTWHAARAKPGTWQHMFPGRLRPCHLTALHTACNRPWQGPDLDRLASSCTSLQELYLCCSPVLQLMALLQLTALTKLCLSEVTGAITMASLSCLSRLHGLQALAIMDRFIASPCRFPDDMLMHLAALTQLTLLELPSSDAFSTTVQQRLETAHKRLDYSDDPFSACLCCLVIMSTAPAGAPPDVWSQLLACCEGQAAQDSADTAVHDSAADAAVEEQQQQQQQEAAAAPVEILTALALQQEQQGEQQQEQQQEH